MKKFFFALSLLLLFIFFNTFSQSISEKDENSSITIVHSDSVINLNLSPQEITYCPRADKKYYWYSSHRIKITQGGYSGTLLQGDYLCFYPDNQLKERGKFINGLKCGKWIGWFPNGTIKYNGNWKNGYMNGAFSLYDSSGKKERTIIYKKNVVRIKKVKSKLIKTPKNSRIKQETKIKKEKKKISDKNDKKRVAFH